VAEESQAAAPTKLPTGFVSQARASRLTDLIFQDLPKALAVVKAELEKCEQLPGDFGRTSTESFQSWMFSVEGKETGLEVDDMCRALLEGWRVSALLLDQHMANFSWRETVLSFVKADTHMRGWLDPHEVQEAERRVAFLSGTGSSDLPTSDQTSLGAFVFRAVNLLGGMDQKADTDFRMTAPMATTTTEGFRAATKRQKTKEACLQVSLAAFQSLEKSLGVYLAWLLHSEEPCDVSVYHGVKSRIYGVRRAASNADGWPCAHNLRCLLLLLLGHQFDMQCHRGEESPEHLGWQLTSLLRVLRESWRRGAEGTVDGPEFGEELDKVGEETTSQMASSGDGMMQA